jgi:hypothetical protein
LLFGDSPGGGGGATSSVYSLPPRGATNLVAQAVVAVPAGARALRALTAVTAVFIAPASSPGGTGRRALAGSAQPAHAGGVDESLWLLDSTGAVCDTGVVTGYGGGPRSGSTALLPPLQAGGVPLLWLGAAVADGPTHLRRLGDAVSATAPLRLVALPLDALVCAAAPLPPLAPAFPAGPSLAAPAEFTPCGAGSAVLFFTATEGNGSERTLWRLDASAAAPVAAAPGLALADGAAAHPACVDGGAAVGVVDPEYDLVDPESDPVHPVSDLVDPESGLRPRRA